MIDPYLIDAYLHTTYHVFEPAIIIRIGEPSPALDDLLKQHRQAGWAFITAFNPASEILSDAENLKRHEQLLKAVHPYIFFEGEGRGENPPWKPERSLLVIGIDPNTATRIGSEFGQNAIVVGKSGEPAELLLLK